MHRNHIFSLFFVVGLALLITGCNQTTGGGYAGKNWNLNQPQSAAQAPGTLTDEQIDALAVTPAAAAEDKYTLQAVKVAILLPLTGKNATLGEAMLNAAQMAMFDVAHNSFELMPYDTQGTNSGARLAAQNAIKQGAELILGPVFADAVRGAKQVATQANVNLIGFSTDWSLAGNNTFIMGFLPFDQVDRVMKYAALQNITDIGALIPNDNYGQVVSATYKKAAQTYGLNTVIEERFAPGSKNLSPTVQRFAMKNTLPAQAGAVPHQAFQAALMPAGGQTALSIANLLSYYGLPPRKVRRIGTGLLDDTRLAREDSLQGAWFAGPPPKARSNFESKYVSLYASKPPRIATLAYDATALAAVLAQRGLKKTGRPAYDRTSISNPNGFAGVDGIFRFRRDGTAERGLAVLEFRGGRIVAIDPAPKTFEKQQF